MQKKQQSWSFSKERIAIISLILLSFTGVSVGNIGKAMVTPFHLLMGGLIAYVIFIAPKKDLHVFLSLLVLIFYVIANNTYNYTNVRITSVIYTVVFALETIILYNLLRMCTIAQVQKAFKVIIYVYFLNVFIATLFALVGLKNGAIESIIRIYYMDTGEARPMGFSSEPSYAAFIISIAFMCYNHLNRHQWNRKVMKLTACYLLSIVFMKSAYGFIFVFFNILDWFIQFQAKLNLHQRLFIYIIAVAVFFAGSIVINSSGNESIERITGIVDIMADPFDTIEKKLTRLQEKDGSAFARIGPTYILFNSPDRDDINLVIGKGAGMAGEFFANFLQGILVDEGAEKLDMGIIPAFIFDYGMIGFFFFCVVLMNALWGLPLPFWLTFLVVLPNANINTQLLWFGMIACFILIAMKKSTLFEAYHLKGENEVV